ncbi:hypothetical protein ACX0G7_26820 [Flavitalea antarctica]
MNTNTLNTSKLEWLGSTIHFFQKHFFMVLTLGLVAGIGRVIQLKGFGEISPATNIVMEVIVESARLALFVYILGSASLKMGLVRLAGFFKKTTDRKALLKLFAANFKSKWPVLLLNFAAYLVIAWGINLLIDQLAYETCLYLTMQIRGILSADASEWTIILFFKNLTVIPLTLIFNTLFMFYMTNKLRLQTSNNSSS